MSMNNDSLTNEKLIKQIRTNITNCGNRSKVSVFYWSIINLTILKSISSYEKYVTQTSEESIAHHGCINPLLKFSYPEKQRDKNIAIAMRKLRKKIPYNTALYCIRNIECDTLYHAINDFKYDLNSWGHNYFNLKQGN